MAVGLAAMALASPGSLGAQVLRGGADSLALPVDSSDVLSRARREQARFERNRIRRVPPTWSRGSGGCQEVVGRFCFWFDDDGRVPPGEPAEVGTLRDDLLAYLDSVQALLPGEGWITGQRVWYLGEARRWHASLDAARRCEAAPWWCSALEGFALHGLGRYEDAEGAFRRALTGMEPDRAERWRDLRWLLAGDARGALDDARRDRGEGAVEGLWALADPLLLVGGNDRKTEHYARWTAATLQADARNPFGIRWGRDMDELTVRMGWEIAWERVRDSGPVPSAIGHHHPDGRDFFPTGEGIRRPAEASTRELEPERPSPRSAYAPGRAQQILPLAGQVAVFPRGGEMVVVATHFLPPDTASARGLARERTALRARMAPPGSDTHPPRGGLFLLPEFGGEAGGVEVVDQDEGVLLLEAPAGRYVLAVESWHPTEWRAGRLRTGVARDTVPPDVATLSDLLLLQGGGEEEEGVETAALRALVRPSAAVGDPLAVAWEVHGLGWTPTEVRYELSVERDEVGLFRRLGEVVGLVDPDRPLVLSWAEPGPSRPGPALRVVALDLGSADPGVYRVTLRAHLPGRGVLSSRTRLRLLPARIDDEARPS